MKQIYEEVWEELALKHVAAMDKLQIPVESENPINRTAIRACLVPFRNNSLVENGLHMMRAGIRMVQLTEILGFKNGYWRNVLFAANSIHDVIKGYPVEGFNPYTFDAWKSFDEERDMPVVRRHVLVDEYPLPDLGQDVKQIIGGHYEPSSKPYSGNKKESTPEQKTAIQLTTLIDCFDALNSRRRKSKDVLVDRCFLLDSETVKKNLIAAHGEMQISYSGAAFPTIMMSGKQVIEMCYENGVFREDMLPAGIWPIYKSNAQIFNYTPLKSLKNLAIEIVFRNRLNPF